MFQVTLEKIIGLIGKTLPSFSWPLILIIIKSGVGGWYSVLILCTGIMLGNNSTVQMLMKGAHFFRPRDRDGSRHLRKSAIMQPLTERAWKTLVAITVFIESGLFEQVFVPSTLDGYI